MRDTFIISLSLLVFGGACASMQRSSSSQASAIKRTYERQVESNNEARLSQNKADLKEALDETEKGWFDTISIFQVSEVEKLSCQAQRDKCAGERDVYQYIAFGLAALILVYLGLRISPLGRFIPLLLIIPALFSFTFSLEENSKAAIKIETSLFFQDPGS